jgi:hypothetical protein
MDTLEKNLSELISKNTTLAAKLHAIKTNKRYEVFMDEKDPINVNLYDTQKESTLYETKPVEEITARYEQIMTKKSRYPFLVFYGMANGLLVKMFTNIGKYVFVIEPDLEMIYIALSLFDFSNEIREDRLKISLEADISFVELNRVFADKEIKAFLKTYDLEINHPYYFLHYQENIKRINKDIVAQISHIITGEGNDIQDSLIGLNHHLKHIPQMLESYTLESIKKNINTKSAVIVSTGPSLAKQLPLLKEYQDYITILCIDASLPILQSEGIKPDLVFSLERVEATAKFYENLDKELLKDTIFMPASLVHPKTLENIGNMKKAIIMRPFSYTRMFRLKKWGYIGIGMSAANMAFDFAYVAKFENVALIGQDLSFGADGKTHSKGAIYGEEEQQYKKNTLSIPGYYGGEVKTSKVWKMFLNFFVKDIPVYKEEGIGVYNCTEGGAYIDGADHIPFQEFLEKIVQKEQKKAILKGECVTKAKQEHYKKRVKKLIELYLKRLKWIQGEVEATFLEVMKKIEMLERCNDEERLEEIDFDEILRTIDKIDKIKDIYETDNALVKFGNITNPLIVNAELELGRIMVRESNTDDEKKVKLIDWIYEHKSWLFFLAGALENIIYIYKENYEAIYKDL